MNLVTISDFKYFTIAELEKLCPFIITINGEEVYMVDKKENVIVTSDLHPAVRIQLKAQEAKARLGMPKTDTRIYGRPTRREELARQGA